MGPERKPRWFDQYEMAELQRRKAGSIIINGALLTVQAQLEASADGDPDDHEEHAVQRAQNYARVYGTPEAS